MEFELWHIKVLDDHHRLVRQIIVNIPNMPDKWGQSYPSNMRDFFLCNQLQLIAVAKKYKEKISTIRYIFGRRG